MTRCELYPGWQFADGSDIAFCTLSEGAIDPALLIHPLSGCSFDQLTAGVATTLVGFRQRDDSQGFGAKRAVVTTVAEVGDEVRIGDATAGT